MSAVVADNSTNPQTPQPVANAGSTATDNCNASPRRDRLKSSLRSMNSDPSVTRLDRHGNVIKKGGSHHLSFCDQQETPEILAEVREVQAYKNPRPGCQCTIT
eukprot:TRINITY_DN58779_c0_g1_i1.p2 TRINITY_DN58779_c0_g1~~TRINITY_DN58779_c0_g1_i1.p2  ORF type:complete len:103 (-),score=10.01 TRINITY_DN58779_c0_g1_i1:231-539(-)